MVKVLVALLVVFFLLLSASYAFAGVTSGIDDPLAPAGFGSLGEVITLALPIVFGLVALLTVVVFSVGALRFMASRGDAKAAEGARNTMTGAVIGFVIVLGAASVSGVFQAIFGTGLFGTPFPGNPPAGGSVDLSCAFRLTTGICIGDRFANFGELVTFILLLIVTVGALIFFFMLLYGGFRYMLARGDDKAVNDARATLTSAFVGLLLMVGAIVIIRLIAFLLFDSADLITS